MIIDYNNKIIEYSKYRVTEYPVRHRAKVPFNPSFRLNIKYRTVISRIREADTALGRMILGAADYRDLVIRTYSAQAHWSVNVDGTELRVSVLETTAPKLILDRKDSLMASMPGVAQEDGADQVLLFVIDILNEEATLLVPNDLVKKIAEASFGCTVEGDTVVLPGLMSRKKQIIPALKV